MGKTAKIIVGIVVVAIIAWLVYMFFGSQNNSTNTVQGSNNTGGVIMGTGNPYDQEHLQRTLNSGGTPGDGGGG
jgi:hypothetical protein